MRRAVSSITLLLTVAACGAFGKADDSSSGSTTPPPQTPDQNAQPPIQGAPLTGIFASSSKGGAAPDADGSMDKPFKTLKDAIAVAQESGQRVIACAEEYDEAVVLPDGVSMYGYYDCTQSPWARANAHAVVKSPTSPALTIKDAPHAMRVDGFEFDAPNVDAAAATDPSKASSIAAWVANAAMLTFGSDILKAGNAAPGVDGTDESPNQELGTPGGANALNQADHPSCSGTICFINHIPAALPGGTSICRKGAAGGAGGASGRGVYYYSNDGTCTPPAGYTAQGQPYTATAATAQGGAELARGNDGSPGAEGSDGMNGAYKLDTTGFHPGDGTKGGDGAPGQGGGGSGGNHEWSGNNPYCPSSMAMSGPFQTGSGASGGAGGCAGFAGTPGTGGGASIGIFIVASGVTFEEGAVQSSSGGRAGRGTLGSSGLAGAAGGLGSGDTEGLTLDGGHGGPGGAGGLSGHGAPGPSFAIAYTGDAPTIGTATQVQAGSGGAGQAALQKTSNGKTHSLPAVTGLAQAEYQF